MWSKPMVAVAISLTDDPSSRGGVAPGAGTDDQGVGIPDIGRCDGFPGEVFHPGIRFEYSFQKRYGIVGDDFHDGIRIG